MTKRRLGIGLDVGSRGVHLAVLKAGRNGITVERLASKELPPDALVEGQSMDSELICEKISELLKENRLRGKEAAISVGSRQVMIKKIATDEMSDDELGSAILYEARNHLSMDISEVSFDYARLPQDAETGRMDVLLVAAKNDVVFDVTETLRWSGGRPQLLEAEPIALQAMLMQAGYFDGQDVVAALQVGFQSTDVTLFREGQFDSNRDVSVGGKSYIEGLIRELGVPFERAIGILARSEHAPEESAILDAIAIGVSEKVADQIERAFPEQFGANADKPVSKVVLCGGGAHLPRLAETLRTRLGVDVDVADPFRNLDVNPKTVPVLTEEVGPDYAAAIGLALRALGDEHPGFNLLFPADRPGARKQSYAGAATIVPILMTSALLFGMVLTYVSQDSQLAALRGRLSDLKRETDLYRDKIRLVEDLTAKRADVAARIDVISSLDRNRFSRVRLLQILNDHLPELTWITNVQEVATSRGPGINVSGVTSSNLKVSQFMANLLKSPLVPGVDLLVSEQSDFAGTDVTQFTLQVALPALGLNAPSPVKPVDQLKQGAEAIREKRKTEDKLKEEAAK